MIIFNGTTQYNKMNHLNANSELMMAIMDHMDWQRTLQKKKKKAHAVTFSAIWQKGSIDVPSGKNRCWIKRSVTHYCHRLLSRLISHIICNYNMVIILSVYNSQVCFQYDNEGNKIPLMYPSAFFPHINQKQKQSFVLMAEGRGLSFSEWKSCIPPNWARRRDGWMDEYMASQRSWPPPHSNLFNIVREMTLRSEVLNFSPDGKQKQWSRSNCDVTIQHTASDQRGTD